MKPYLTPNEPLAFVIQWGLLIVSILLVFSPFIYLGIRKWKKQLTVGWWQVMGAYIASVVIFVFYMYFASSKLGDWLVAKYPWLDYPFVEALSHLLLVFPLVLVLSVFYSTLLIRSKFTILNIIVSILIAAIITWIFILLLPYAVGLMLGYIRSHI
ncbi:MAG: hypothetical protein AAB719_00385 [Patescibacteria group bacterium]